MKEQQIIHTVIQALQEQGIKAVMKAPKYKALDGLIALTTEDIKIALNAEVKFEIRSLQLPHIEDMAQQYVPYVLVAWRLFPNLRQRLREQGINYIEANGNLYVKQPGAYLFVDNQKPLKEGGRKTNRAFTKTGLKVIFQMLLNKELINQTQREIAEAADAGLGNVPQVIKGLLDTGYIVRYDKKTFQWKDREALLKKWVMEYATTLKPALLQGRYRLPEGKNWQDLALQEAQTCWGGEPAGEALTRYLRPEVLTLYTKETRPELMKNYKLQPVADGNVVVYEKFWPQAGENGIVPPLLAYADLVNNNDKRSMETAQKIYDQYVRPEL